MRKSYPKIAVDKRLRRTMLITNIMIAFLFLVAVGVGFAVWEGWISPPKSNAVPPVADLPTPSPIVVTPLHDHWRLSYAVAAAFLSVMVYHGQIEPIVDKAFRRSGASWSGALYAAMRPVWGQPSLRASTLAAGIIGISLWHLGTAVLSPEVFDTLLTLVIPVQIVGLAFHLTILGKPWRTGRAALGSVNMWFVLYTAVWAARWVT